jgi:hypothetical protein
MVEREIEKNPGPDWVVVYIDLSSGEEGAVTVFGQETMADAIGEADLALKQAGDGRYRIVSARMRKII